MNEPAAVTMAYLFFLLAVTADIAAILLYPEARLLTKPLLMPMLMWAYASGETPKSLPSRLMLSALSMSWLGDIILMFEDRWPIMFVFGLCSFLSAHILYIAYFASIRSDRSSFLKSRPVMLIGVAVLVFELMNLLWPGLGEMKVPVLIYAITIGTMLAMALWQYGRVPDAVAWLFIGGAAAFVLSDALLALNRFRMAIPHANVLVMLTYCLAQYLLVRGGRAHLKSSADALVG